MCLYILKYISDVSCSTCSTCIMLDMLAINIVHSWLFDLQCSTCLMCHMTSLSSTNPVTRSQYLLLIKWIWYWFSCVVLYHSYHWKQNKFRYINYHLQDYIISQLWKLHQIIWQIKNELMNMKTCSQRLNKNLS